MIALWLLDTDSFGMIPRSLLNLLDSTEEEKSKVLRPADQRRFLISRIALRQALSNVFGGDPRAWRFIIGKSGKVNLAHCYGMPLADFSLSYSGKAMALAVSTSGPVGLDLEEAARDAAPSHETVFPDHQFSDGEKKYLEQIPEKTRWSETLKIWTRKEAYSKLLGLGLHLDYSKLDVTTEPAQRSGVKIETQEVSIAEKPYYLSLVSVQEAPDTIYETVDIRSPSLLSCATC
jgi:4'-phosphopantetheinyl transferase